MLKSKAKRADIFGYPVNITTKKDAVDFVLSCLKMEQGLHIITINPEIIAAADKNSELAKIIRQAGLIIPDSTGMMLAIKSAGLLNAEKIPGIEFSEALIAKCAESGLKVAFIGGEPGIIEKIDFPGINLVFAQHGYFKDEEMDYITKKLVEAEPDLLLVGLGSPKQDFFIDYHRKYLPKAAMIGVGGSFEVWAKKVKRAPTLFRVFGLEWFYRLITQPARFKRMFPVLPLFFIRILFDRKSLGITYEHE